MDNDRWASGSGSGRGSSLTSAIGSDFNALTAAKKVSDAGTLAQRGIESALEITKLTHEKLLHDKTKEVDPKVTRQE